MASCTRRSDSGIERAGGLVEDEDRRVAQEGAGDGDALALPANDDRRQDDLRAV